MPQQLKSYLLQKMGIDLWVRRSSAPQPVETAVMIVLEEVEPAEKASVLLTKMLHSLGLASENTAIFYGVPSKTDQEIQLRDVLLAEKIERLKPRLILILGQFFTQCCHRIPIIVSDHPTDLLNNPIKKKKAFADWMKVKQIVG